MINSRRITTLLGAVALLVGGVFATSTAFADTAKPGASAVNSLDASWHYVYTGLPPYHQLDANPSTMNNNGGIVWQWQYNGAIQQQWYFLNDYTIRPAGNTGMCLDGDPDTNWNGGTVYLWSCNNSSQQRWYHRSNDAYQNGYSGRCLDANPNTNYNGGTIYQWDCNNAAQQHWYSGHA